MGSRATRVVSRAPSSAALASATLLSGSLLLRIASPPGTSELTPSSLVPQLWALGGIVVLALTHTWAPTLAWSATIISSTASALGINAVVRDVRLGSGTGANPVLEALLVVALLVPPAIAAAYATAQEPRPRLVVGTAWGSVGVLAAVLLVGFAGRTIAGRNSGPGLPQWTWLLLVGVLAGIGLIRDLRPAIAGTRLRLAQMDGGTPLSALRVLLDELVPGREAGRAEAAESERGRIAADLHAEVLPALRQAMVAAETGGTVERLAVDLRAAVDEVESLLAARRSIVLEEIGLLAAVEWLAERVEERSAVRVGIDVTDTGPARVLAVPAAEAAVDRPPRNVERAAFRVAQLALDNVVRHAPSSNVVVSLAVGPDRVEMTITDDGPGIALEEVTAARQGRRGIADMRAEARACGATIHLRPGAVRPGTSVGFHWQA
jgi:signal transduction histidine kinase